MEGEDMEPNTYVHTADPVGMGRKSCLYAVHIYWNIVYVCIKDHIEKIDFQDIFIAVVNWPISELYGAFVCIMHYLDQSATS